MTPRTPAVATAKTLAGTLILMLALAFPAAAAPITSGEISINGANNFTSTSVTFTATGNLGGTQGDFNILPVCNACVTMTGNTFNSAFNGTLYTVNDAGLISTLVVNSGSSFVLDGTPTLPNLTVNGTGTLTLSGFTPTPGSFELTTQGAANETNVTFSATAIPTPTSIPEPSTLAVLFTGLVGLVAWRHRVNG